MKATETRTLESKFTETLKATGGCSIEIRCPMGNTIGERLQRSLATAGVKTHLIHVVASANTGILIESSTDCAGIALSIQSALKAIEMEAHLLVQYTPRPQVVVIHLNSVEPV